MSVLDRLDKMLKAGVPYDTALDLARGFEADIAQAVRETAAAVASQLAQMPPAKSKAALRTEKWRAKQASQNVTEPSPRDAEATVTDRHETSPDRHAVTPLARGLDNLSRLEVTGLVVVGGVEHERVQQTDDWPKGDAHSLAKLLVRTVDSPWLDPAKSPDLVTTTGRIAAWKRDGASWEHDVLAVVRGLCANRRARIATWKFFDASMGRSIADNRQALSIPEATSRRPGQGPPSLTERIGADSAEAKRIALEKLSAKNG